MVRWWGEQIQTKVANSSGRQGRRRRGIGVGTSCDGEFGQWAWGRGDDESDVEERGGLVNQKWVTGFRRVT